MTQSVRQNDDNRPLDILNQKQKRERWPCHIKNANLIKMVVCSNAVWKDGRLLVDLFDNWDVSSMILIMMLQLLVQYM